MRNCDSESPTSTKTMRVSLSTKSEITAFYPMLIFSRRTLVESPSMPRLAPDMSKFPL